MTIYFYLFVFQVSGENCCCSALILSKHIHTCQRNRNHILESFRVFNFKLYKLVLNGTVATEFSLAYILISFRVR